MREMDHTNGMLDTVEEYFEGQQWRFERMAEAPVLRTGFTGDHGTYGCIAIADQRVGLFIFQSFGPEKVPEKGRAKVAEFLTRINWNFLVGAFGMDYEDGEIRFRTSVDVSDDRLSAALVENAIRANLVVMDMVWPTLQAVVSSDLTAEEACEMLAAPSGTVH